MPANGPAVGFSKRNPTQAPGRVPVPRVSGARKLSRCKEGLARFLASMYKFYWALRVSRYKFDRSRESIPGYNACCGHWRSVAVQVWSEPGNCQGAGFILRAGAGVRVQDLVGSVMGAGFAKTMTSPLIIPSVLGFRTIIFHFINLEVRCLLNKFVLWIVSICFNYLQVERFY